MLQSKIYPSQLYRNFKAVNAAEHRKVVHFYERHEQAILNLEFDEYFELAFAYTIALFEIGEYRKHLLMADMVIETSFAENIPFIDGHDVLQTLLFKKAAAYFNLYEHEKAIHLLEELIRINPNEPTTARFLERCLRESKPEFVRRTRAFAIAAFLSAALFIFTEILIFAYFFPDFAHENLWLLQSIRFGFFGLGLLILIVGELIHRFRAHQQVQLLVSSVLKRKSGIDRRIKKQKVV